VQLTFGPLAKFVKTFVPIVRQASKVGLCLRLFVAELTGVLGRARI